MWANSVWGFLGLAVSLLLAILGLSDSYLWLRPWLLEGAVFSCVCSALLLLWAAAYKKQSPTSKQPGTDRIVRTQAVFATKSIVNSLPPTMGGKSEIDIDNVGTLRKSVPYSIDSITFVVDGVVTNLPGAKTPEREIEGVKITSGYDRQIVFDKDKNQRHTLVFDGRTFEVRFLESNVLRNSDVANAFEWVFAINEQCGESKIEKEGKKKRILPLIGMMIFGVFFIGFSVFYFLPSINKKQQTEPTKPSISTAGRVYRTLEKLFETDFFSATYQLYFDRPFQLVGPTGPLANGVVRTGVFTDRNSHSEFISYYVPKTTDDFNVIKMLSTWADGSFKFAREHAPVMYDNALQPEQFKDRAFVFTKKVYVYHEGELTPAQAGDLWKIFSDSGLSLELRGPDYPIRRWQQGY